MKGLETKKLKFLKEKIKSEASIASINITKYEIPFIHSRSYVFLSNPFKTMNSFRVFYQHHVAH